MTATPPWMSAIDISGTDHQVATWIWRNLVPERGQASTVQGELLRAVEKLRWEAQENGNINWDESFLMLLDFLHVQLAGHADFSPTQRRAIEDDIARLRAVPAEPGASDEIDQLYNRLEAAVVAFARAHPQPLALARNPHLCR